MNVWPSKDMLLSLLHVQEWCVKLIFRINFSMFLLQFSNFMVDNSIRRLFRVNSLLLSKPLLVSYTYCTKSDKIKHMLRLRTSSSPKYILLDPAASFANSK